MTIRLKMRALVFAVLLAGAGSVHAQSTDSTAKPFTMPAQPPESKEESNNKAIVLDWFRMTFQEGKAAEAFEKYVSRDFKEHSRRLRGGYDSTLKSLSAMKPRTLNPKALVNDEIVLVQSEIGNEVFRVQNGKITDHWDVNP